jgi:hypothetical protein
MAEDFSRFHESLLDLVKSFEKKNVLVKLNSDPNSNVIRIYGEQSDGLSLAKIGLEEIEELALTTAEHHPYWNLLYNGSQIIKIVLEKWNDKLTEDEIREILWYTEEMKNASSNVSLHGHDD